jgi:hypothetical protein
MMGRGPQSFKKRQKEQRRKEKQQEKIAKRLERKLHAKNSTESEVQDSTSGDLNRPERSETGEDSGTD